MNEAHDRTRRVVTGESGLSPYSQVIVARRHVFTADEPVGLGGSDTGPDPMEMLMASLAACTVITVRMYAQRHDLPLGRLTVSVEHQWVRDDRGRLSDRFEKMIHLNPMPDPDVMQKIIDIAERCPVHRAMSGRALIETRADP